MFNMFPEVLLIDATHGTNASKYKVFSFMVHEAFGKGQFVQHAVLRNERRSTLLTAIEGFEKNNAACAQLQCIIVDKAFTELSVLKEAFPNVSILLCQFHVIKYLQEQVAIADYRFTAWQKTQIRSLISFMVYAKTEREYIKHIKYLRHVVNIGCNPTITTEISQNSRDHEANPPGENVMSVGPAPDLSNTELVSVGQLPTSDQDSAKHPFESYFDKNWDNCRNLWCSYRRQSAVTLGNNTNNRLDSSWNQLKDLMNSFMGLDECIATIMYHEAREERRFLDRVHKLVVVHNAKKYREAHVVASSISDVMSGLGMHQYLVAMEALKQVVEKFKHGAFSDLADLAQHDSIKTQESGGNQSRSTCSSPETVPPTNCFSPETEPTTVPSTELNPEEAPSNEDKVPAIGGMPNRVAGVLDYGNSTVGCVTTVHSELVVHPSEKCTQPTGVCTQTDSGIAQHQVDLNLENTEFDIASPPRARGRPKVKPKSVKAKRNLGVALAAEDAEMFDSQLSLAPVAQVVASAPRYIKAATLLFRFKRFVFKKKPKPPIARKILSLPVSKPVITASKVVRVFPRELLRRCDAKVVALQMTKSGLAERDVAIEIIGLGVFSTETLTIMKPWHRAMETIKQIDKEIKWAKAIDFGSQVPEEFRTQRADNLPTKIYDLPLLSPKSKILELAAKGWISDATMCMMLNTIFGSNGSILTIDTSTIGIVIDGKNSTDRTTLQNIFSAIKEEVVLIPINCKGIIGARSWCDWRQVKYATTTPCTRPTSSVFGQWQRP
ncbi:unnamed protein product [Phytophthora fragariaefolia]|uniref:Unnamed protein product n=1 Tax=Phytophthora fragariaefolia TaxID=1490495 RepID=A0A9W7CWA6_9STRA|nr:unnamed protein product [Phytophthora fragariaefolia]